MDLLTNAAAWIAAALLGLIVLFFWFEVVSRHFFDAPTSWAGPGSQYLLLVVVMLMLPWLSRDGAHVAMSFVFDHAPARFSRPIIRVIATLSALACLIACWFCSIEMIRQFAEDARSPDSFLFPMWRLTAMMVFGFALAAVHFLRQAVSGDAPRHYEG